MNDPAQKSLTAALLLGFAPALLSLLNGTTSGQSGPSSEMLWSLCVVSVFCCFASSFLMFRRRTGWAIMVGIIFLLLNAMISFFTGCVAFFKSQ